MGYKTEVDGHKVSIIRGKTDPKALRISMGGSKKNGFYFHFCGNSEYSIKHCVDICVEAFNEYLRDLNENKTDRL